MTKLHHPFGWLSPNAQKNGFVLLLISTLAVMASLQLLGGPLVTEAAPAGIVSFEFAGDLATAREMVASWGPEGQIYAGLNLGLDYLFLALYPSAIGLGCVLVAQRLPEKIKFLGVMLAWGQLAAGFLDAVENFALIQVLLETELPVWPVVAWWCAAPKFLLVIAGLVYFLLGGGTMIFMKVRRFRSGQAL